LIEPRGDEPNSTYGLSRRVAFVSATAYSTTWRST
jgi:hypothetical protein